jgi:hypothetical protein
MKTYTIYMRRCDENKKPISDFSKPLSFRGVKKSEALGAMKMADIFYSTQYEFVCKCDQTDEEIGHVYPKTLHIN